MKCYIQLADYGALLNLLPLCLADAESGEKSCIVTTKPYADLLEGVSYVDCKVVDCQPYEMDKAVDWTLDHGLRPGICTQVNGPAELVKRYTYEPVGQKSAVTTSWQKEQWKVAGRLDRWDDCLPLKFDRRNLVRETRLWRDTFPAKNLGKKPIMLLALNGNSSPFPNKDLLAYLLKTTFGDRWRIVEIPKAACLYDLLGFYEKASLLVAVDSAPLHLAWAVRSLPVIAFANDQPIMWAGSSWRPNMVWYCRYGDFLSRWREMLDVIGCAPAPENSRKHLIAWSEYESQSRRPDFFWRHLPITIGACGRDSSGILKDPKRVPFLRDCLRMAIQKANPEQSIVLTRTGIRTDTRYEILTSDAAYAYRIQEGSFAPICDLFTAPREWWKYALQDIPDLLLDSGYWWSETLRAVFLRRGAVDITGVCSRPKPEKSSPPLTEIPPRMKHNRELCEKYMTDNGVTARYPAVSEQVETLPLDTSKLYPGGYNPTIIEHDGKLLMAYRYHGDTLATSLAVAHIGAGGDIMANAPITNVQESFEDPKFFKFDGKLFMSWVRSKWPSEHPKSVVEIGELASVTLKRIACRGLPGNDGQSIQKNAVFFERGGVLYCIWHCSPTQQIFTVSSDTVTPLQETEGPRWAYGPIKGGTAPLEYDGKLLRFFHSTLDNEFALPHKMSARRRYFMGACLMEPSAPLKTVAVSKRPIVFGSESGGSPDLFHFKPRVVFPGGAIVRDDHFIVAVGVNDCQCCLLKIKPEALNL